MATTTTPAAAAAAAKPKLEWLVMVPDKTEPGTLQKRIEIRATHLANIAPAHAAGLVPLGGAYLHAHPTSPTDTPQMAGSALVLVAESEAAVRAVLRADVYAREGVWDVERATVWPFRTAVRSALA